MTKAKKVTPDKPKGHYRQTLRLIRMLDLFYNTSGTSTGELAERFGITRRTVNRDLTALQEAHVPIYYEVNGREHVWRLMPSARRSTISLTSREILSLYLGKSLYRVFEGTDFHKDIVNIYDTLEKTLRDSAAEKARDFSRKYYYIADPVKDYTGHEEHMDEVISALQRTQKLRLDYKSRTAGRSRARVVRPYTLLVYKQGLYLVAYDESHDEIRVFALERVRGADWLRGEDFDYPSDYSPETWHQGMFGIIGEEEPTTVVVWFAQQVREDIIARKLHETQTLRDVGDGAVELTMTVRGTKELRSWILSYGKYARVLKPARLRDKIAGELRAAMAGYE